MKRFSYILLLIFIFCSLPIPATRAALNFSADTHRVEFPFSPKSNGITNITIGGWMRPTSFTADVSQMIIGKNDDPLFAGYFDLLAVGSNGRIHLSGGRATTETNIQSADNELTTGVYQFVAASAIRSSTTNTDFKLYKATAGTSVAEVSSYAVRNPGSGTPNNTDSLPWQTGNTSNNSTYYASRADYDLIFVANKVLSAGELEIIKNQPHCYKDASGNGLVHLWHFVAGVAIDMCDAPSNGTVTGATPSTTGMPIGNRFGL